MIFTFQTNTNRLHIVVKIPKEEDIAEVFNYTRKELEKVKALTLQQKEVIAINEFYELIMIMYIKMY